MLSPISVRPTIRPPQLQNALYFLASSLQLLSGEVQPLFGFWSYDGRHGEKTCTAQAGASIVCPVGTFNCMVRNLSEQGAALDLENLIAIPRDFTLVIPTDGTRYFCQGVWRNGARIGVAFASLH
jgi:PilZ domain-containing protein